jgi:transposase-like protein
MNPLLFASIALATLRTVSWHEPSVCPFCPGNAAGHWIRWGGYKRYADNRDKKRGLIRIQRFFCKIVHRTFSLLPDSLLPYRYFTTSRILRWLYAIVVKRAGASTIARRDRIARSSLRHIVTSFLKTVPSLRLPDRPAALDPPGFLTALADLGNRAVANLFRRWKELEPKQSILGFYPR